MNNNIKISKPQKNINSNNPKLDFHIQQMQTYSKYSTYTPQSCFMKCYGTFQKQGYTSGSTLISASNLNAEFNSKSAQDKNIDNNMGAGSCLNSVHVKIRKYYKILNVEQNCTDLELRRAYRKLALQIHPDKISKQQQKQPQENPSSQAFRLLNKIYSKVVAYRKKFPQTLQPSLSTLSNPQPFAYPQPESPMTQNRSIFKQFQNNFNQHLQTLDNILDSLNSMKRQPRESRY